MMTFFKLISHLVRAIGMVSIGCQALFALEEIDRLSIQKVIGDYVDAWNHHEGVGFGEGFTHDADFVNIYGMILSGKKEIEDRHIHIIRTFLQGSQLEIVNIKLREAAPLVVIAQVHWRLLGYRSPRSDPKVPGETREGIFTHTFLHAKDKWEITASQNTLIAK